MGLGLSEMLKNSQVWVWIRSSGHGVECLVDTPIAFSVDRVSIEFVHFRREVAGWNNRFSLPLIPMNGGRELQRQLELKRFQTFS